jgi:hypothetical protein
MRVALVAREPRERAARALAALGVRVLGLSPARDAVANRIEGQYWTWESLPCAPRETQLEDARSFREAVQARLAQFHHADVAPDVIHTLDSASGPAALAIANASPRAALVASITGDDLVSTLDAPGIIEANRWIADHPWVADILSAGAGYASRVSTILPAVVPAQGVWRNERERVVLVAFWVERHTCFDTDAVASAVLAAHAQIPELQAVVLGAGPLAHRLHRRLESQRLTAQSLTGPAGRSADDWSSWVGRAHGLGLAGDQLASNPAAWLAWERRVPVFSLDASRCLDAELLDTISHQSDRASATDAACAYVARRRSHENVAEQWLAVYWNAMSAPRPAAERTSPAPTLMGTGRSRLALVPVSTREIYATWHARADDQRTALDCLGARATRATLCVRLQDITDIEFNGSNAHETRDVDLAPAEHFRFIGFDSPGRSVLGTLGVRGSTGYFHPLAHAGPVHLPREQWAPESSWRKLHVLPRRA